MTRLSTIADAGAPSEPAGRDEGKQVRFIQEGKATILIPESAKIENETSEAEVFYNPIQQYNRDLSVLAIKAYGEWALETRAMKARDVPKNEKKSKKRKRGRDTDGAPTTAPAAETQTQQPALAAQPQEPVPEAISGEPASELTAEPEPAEAPAKPNASEPAKEPEHTFKILDALSASGLRALRYAHELPFVTSVTANDLSPSAAASIKRNVEHNGLQHIVHVSNQDALALMYRTIADCLSDRDRKGNTKPGYKFDVVDLDPYGTAAPFLDASLQALRFDGGLLCMTCTDSAVWAGHCYSEKTFALYRGIPVKGQHTHEVGIRLILHAVATSAAKYGLAIEPLLSLSIDFYSKFFIRVTKAPASVKFLASKTMIVYSCDSGCGSWETQPLLRSQPLPTKSGTSFFYKHSMAQGPTADRFCQHCGFKRHLSGPMYAGYIHSPEFIQRLLDEIPQASPEVYKTLPRLEGMLQNAMEELIPGPEPPAGLDPQDAERSAIDHYPFYIIPGKVGGVLSCSTPNDDMVRGALKHLGYRVGRSHCKAGSVKTDAPWSTIWWVFTEWIRQKSPVKTSKFTPGMAAYKILLEAGILGSAAEGPAKQEQSTDKTAEADDVTMQDTETAPRETATSARRSSSPARLGLPGKDQPSERELELRKTLVFGDALARLGRQGNSQRYVRYQRNPRPYWGPISKARGH